MALSASALEVSFFHSTCHEVFPKKDIRLRQHVSYLSSLPEETIDWCPSTPHMYTPSQLSSFSLALSFPSPFHLPSQPPPLFLLSLFLFRLFAFSFTPSPSQPSFLYALPPAEGCVRAKHSRSRGRKELYRTSFIHTHPHFIFVIPLPLRCLRKLH